MIGVLAVAGDVLEFATWPASTIAPMLALDDFMLWAAIREPSMSPAATARASVSAIGGTCFR